MTLARVVWRRLAFCIALGLAVTFAVSCDPCFGVSACASPGGYLALDGQIVDAATGIGIDGVTVDVIRRAGVSVLVDSLSAVTSGGGHWRVEFSPESAGLFEADIVVGKSGQTPYRVNDVHLRASEKGGDGNLLGSWVMQPYFPDVGELYIRESDERVHATSATFVRTGGVALFGPLVSNGTIQITPDLNDRFYLFSVDAAGAISSSVGNVVGKLTIRRSPTDSSVLDSVFVRSTQVYREPAVVRRLPYGLTLDYQGEIYKRSTGALLGGVTVDFERTGGVEVSIPKFTRVTLPNGRFSFLTVPRSRGTLNGQIIYTVPPARPETVVVALDVFEAVEGRLYSRFRAGAYFPYTGIVQSGNRPIAGAKVEVRRVGGVAVESEVAPTESDTAGVFGVPTSPTSMGEVIVDIVITPPAPYAATTIRGLHLDAADRTVDARPLGIFQVTGPPSASRTSTGKLRLPP